MTETMAQTLIQHDVEGLTGAGRFVRNVHGQPLHRCMMIQTFRLVHAARDNPLPGMTAQAA